MTSKKMLEEKIYRGIDVGNGYVKSKLAKFPSKIKVGTKATFGKAKKNVYEATFENVTYLVGTGSAFTGLDRYTSTEYKITLLTAIALNFPNKSYIEGAFCVGLPLELYREYHEILRDTFKDKQFNITVEGREVTIRFTDFEVYVEGAYPILLKSDKRILTIDMGAGTINVTLFENQEVENYATYDNSMNELYATICQFLNETKGARFNPSDIEGLINKDTTIINQKVVDITDIRPYITNAIRDIASKINNKFQVSTVEEIYLIGGGALDTSKYWLKHYPNAKVVENGQVINSEIFDAIALTLVEEDEE